MMAYLWTLGNEEGHRQLYSCSDESILHIKPQANQARSCSQVVVLGEAVITTLQSVLMKCD